MKFTEHVFRVPIERADGYQTEVWLLNCKGGLILVDVGFTETCYKNIENELKSISKTWNDVKLILITHAHGDHIDNLQKILEASGNPEVMLGEFDFETLKNQTGIEADMTLGDGDIIDACGGIEIISAPGHSKGNICLFLKTEKLLIVGDTIMIDENGELSAPPNRYSENMGLAILSIKKLLDYDFDKLLLSHGEPVILESKKKVVELVNRLMI